MNRCKENNKISSPSPYFLLYINYNLIFSLFCVTVLKRYRNKLGYKINIEKARGEK
jgi:hypothetical protein